RISLDALGPLIPGYYKTLRIDHQDRVVLDAVDKPAVPLLLVRKRRVIRRMWRPLFSSAIGHPCASAALVMVGGPFGFTPSSDVAAISGCHPGRSRWKIAPPPGASSKLTSP